MEDLDYSQDSFDDIIAKDSRYSPKTYTLLVDVIQFLGKDGKHMSAADVLDEFKERALDLFGPLTYTVLTEWGVSRCEDIGEMMFNLVDSKRISRDEADQAEDFTCGYDFKETFLGPFAV